MTHYKINDEERRERYQIGWRYIQLIGDTAVQVLLYSGEKIAYSQITVNDCLVCPCCGQRPRRWCNTCRGYFCPAHCPYNSDDTTECVECQIGD